MVCQSGNPPTNSAIYPTERNMSWTTPTIVEVCIGMEVTSYQSAGV